MLRLERYSPIPKLQRYGALGSLRLLGYAVSYVVRRRLLRQQYLTRRIHDYRLRLNLRDPGLSRELAIRGSREDQLRYVLRQVLTQGDTVVDVGANIGYYTAMMARLIGRRGHVYALEPEPANFEQLTANIHLNDIEGQVDAFNFAASDRQGTGALYVSTSSNLHTMIPRDHEAGEREGVTAVDVPIVDLTSFLGDKPSVDLLRMDIEGSEVKVLHGLTPAIDSGRFSGTIVFECHLPRYGPDNDMRPVLQALFDRGYRVAMLTSNDERSTHLREYGYAPRLVIRTNDFRYQGVYESVSNDDALTFVCELGGIRDAVLSMEQ